MTSTIVKVGRREFDYDVFVKAVKENTTYSKVCEALGMNKEVQTTLNNLKEIIANMELDISHFTYKYTKTEKFLAANKQKDYKVSEQNQKYFDSMESITDRQSWATYRCTLGNFFEFIGEKDFATVTPEEVMSFVGDKANAKAHIRATMIHIAKSNIDGALDRISKNMLVWLI